MRNINGTTSPARGTPIGKARGMPNARGRPLVKLRDGPLAKARGKPPFVTNANGGVPGCWSPAVYPLYDGQAKCLSKSSMGKSPPGHRKGAVFWKHVNVEMHECVIVGKRKSKHIFKQVKNLKLEWYGFIWLVDEVSLYEVADADLSASAGPDNVKWRSNADLSASAGPDNVKSERDWIMNKKMTTLNGKYSHFHADRSLTLSGWSDADLSEFAEPDNVKDKESDDSYELRTKRRT